MSLYFDAVSILTTPSTTGGSFKSRIYSSRNLKAAPAQIYALIIEASKWDVLLKEVIENAGILKIEPKLTPLLALLLVHDHLLAKNGIAANANHPIRQAVERHKTRLRGEFIKARVRRGCASIPDLKAAVLREKQAALGPGAVAAALYPRWVRINNVRTTLDDQLKSTFASYRKAGSLAELVDKEDARMYIDPNIPDLVAVAAGVDFTSSPAYKNGEIILQDKASCFPAYLLIGDRDSWEGGLVDGCAAPGNKTTHMASLLAKHKSKKSKKGRSHIYSMDASQVRSKTLQKMVSAAGADKIVTVLPGQDFLALDPTEERFENVTGLLLDPSCSGSGIIGRDDVPKLTLPAASSVQQTGRNQGKKRKRNDDQQNTESPPNHGPSPSATDENELSSTTLDPERLTKLSNLQARIVEHALSFPAATRVTYSTCSIHLIENEAVVSRVLASEVAKSGGWRIMRRDEQPRGLKAWKHRGVRTENKPGTTGAVENDNGVASTVNLSDVELDACLRCWPGDEEGLGGFFVAGFVRDESSRVAPPTEKQTSDISQQINEDDQDDDKDADEEEWEGFSD